MKSIEITFGDEKQKTTLKELSEYLYAFLEDEIESNLDSNAVLHFIHIDSYFKETQDRGLPALIEEGLEAFYGGARNE